MITEKEIIDAIKLVENASAEKNKDLFSKTRDVFQARIDTFSHATNKYLESAMIAEIGNNTFDHNFTFAPGSLKGLFFDCESSPDFIYLCDFGAGLRTTLSKIIPEINDDKTAIEVAFTKPVSGRAPELRGNGLKFTISSIVENNWSLYYHSGNAVCNADGNGYSFESSDFNHNGCFCILSCKEF